MITKQHRRFVEFADTVRRNRYIGACYGAPGIGKTLSARMYAGADDWEWWNAVQHLRGAPLPDSLLNSRTALFTPHVITTPRQLEQQIFFRCSWFSDDIQRHLQPDWDPEMTWVTEESPHTELLIVDEAERLKTQGLEQLRDFFDRNRIGLILIGMPGSKSSRPATRSSIAGSGSLTSTGRAMPATYSPSWPCTGAAWASISNRSPTRSKKQS